MSSQLLILQSTILKIDPRYPLEFWNLHAAAAEALPEDFEVIGADDWAAQQGGAGVMKGQFSFYRLSSYLNVDRSSLNVDLSLRDADDLAALAESGPTAVEQTVSGLSSSASTMVTLPPPIASTPK